MGLFGKLFGGSKEHEGATGDRCNECGMTGGRHTDWCPTKEEEGETPTAPTETTTPPNAASDAGPERPPDG